MVTNSIPDFSLSQDDQYVFIKVNVDFKEFNQLTAKPEVLVYDSHLFEFFAEPYLLKLRFNEQVVNMSSEEDAQNVV